MIEVRVWKTMRNGQPQVYVDIAGLLNYIAMQFAETPPGPEREVLSKLFEKLQSAQKKAARGSTHAVSIMKIESIVHLTTVK